MSKLGVNLNWHKGKKHKVKRQYGPEGTEVRALCNPDYDSWIVEKWDQVTCENCLKSKMENNARDDGGMK